MSRTLNALRETSSLGALGQGRALVLDGLLGDARAMAVRAEILALDEDGLLEPASAGEVGVENPAHRPHRSMWLNRELLDPAIGAVVDLMDAAMSTLGEHAYLAMGELDVQVAVYDAGQGYERSRDAAPGDTRGVVSAIYYANDWRPGDGGELALYDAEGQCVRLVDPAADRLVLFTAQTEHAVRHIARGPRVAVTGFRQR